MGACEAVKGPTGEPHMSSALEPAEALTGSRQESLSAVQSHSNTSTTGLRIDRKSHGGGDEGVCGERVAKLEKGAPVAVV